MKYLLDTNIVSELYKPVPHPFVVSWFKKQDSAAIYLSVITIGELRRGVEKKRRQYPDAANRFTKLLAHIELSYVGQIWIFDQKAAHVWGRIMSCYPNNPIDAQIAGIALTNDAVLVTRDTDFSHLATELGKSSGLLLQLLNPFDAIQ